MAKNRRELTVYGGKYTFFTPEDDYKVHVHRYGEEWLVIKAGCNAVAALVDEMVELKAEIAELKKPKPEERKLTAGDFYPC